MTLCVLKALQTCLDKMLFCSSHGLMKQKLADFLKAGYGRAEDLNCAEKVLWGANRAYGLEINEADERLASGFGGGMGIGALCGAAAGSVMILSRIFVSDRVIRIRISRKLLRSFLTGFRS